ncbi:hypothetical protein LGL55_21195 [Clostridium tagluense]|uniref:hypothetical protein n=1 Tax=Clostridium tagluense TaxID=360422 RepID=UPI001CF48942|nr:hypothetical protein [Clostridium tagluense]MCB2318467.1 hypothetical protein [Clostridium tagluense]MCB2323297.1 hypothetical protein [Clostridium tagluense]MCB2328240.1 hypothetical protein [Clostridium tagluense]MCB2332999.1 hypothetical protein [Clostridium tagluense]MCB2337880.1 hypothetical protein [Clostridium tagluense]
MKLYKNKVTKSAFASNNPQLIKKEVKSIIDMDNLPYDEVNRFADDLLNKLRNEGKLNFILK